MSLWQRFGNWLSKLRQASESPLHSSSHVNEVDADDPIDNDFADSVCDVGYILDKFGVSEEEPSSPGFGQAIEALRPFAQQGDNEAQYELARLLSFDGPYTDKESAYLWFYVSLRGQGYSVDFADKNKSPPYYCGPVGDFRNEAEVSDLLVDLGFERIRELDVLAAEWFEKYGSKADA